MGCVYWITGLSGAGKTSIGTLLYEKMKQKYPNTVFLDGDVLREVFGNDLGYTREERIRCAMRYARLCKMLQEQEMNVICCTISMFDGIRSWNRENIKNYREIYVRVSMEVLKKRNQKGLYGTSMEVLKKRNQKGLYGTSMEVQKKRNQEGMHGTSMEVLKKRNQKGLYGTSMEVQKKRNQEGMHGTFAESGEVVGIGIDIEEPKSPDIILDNEGNAGIPMLVDRIIEKFEI